MHSHSSWGPYHVAWVAFVLFVALLGYIGWKVWRQRVTGMQMAGTFAGLVTVALIVLYGSYPQRFNWIFYQGVYAHLGQLIFIAIGLLFGGLAFKYWWSDEGKWNLVITHGVVCVIVMVGGLVLVAECNNLRTYELHQFTEIPDLIEVEPEQVLWTPPQVAHAAMDGTFQSSQYLVSQDYVHGVMYKGGVGYVVPTSPDGIVNTWRYRNDGYVIFDDRLDADPDNNIKPVDDEQPIGVDMEWLDNIWYQLYRDDMTAYYTDYKLLPLDPEDPTKLTAVVPKIEYRYHMKWFIPVAVPEWVGLVLVVKEEDGNWHFDHVSAEDAKKDPRFARQPIFPKSLARLYTDVQIYDQGIAGAWMNREDKIQIPELPGKQQYPHFVPTDNKTSYYQTVVEPEGQSGGMKAVYYVNTHTGERLRHSFPEDVALTGPLTGIQYCKNIRGYSWKEDSGSDKGGQSGTMMVVKPVLLTRQGRVYHKYTITNDQFQGIASTPVVDARTRKVVQIFPDRETFDRWYRGEDVDTSSDGTAARQLAELRRLLNRALSEVGSVENTLSPEKN